MAMDITQSQNTQQQQRQVASPQLVAANHVLALSTAELQALIYQEMAENPAMELEESQLCPRCGYPVQGPTCQVCLQNQQADTAHTREQDDYDESQGKQQTYAKEIISCYLTELSEHKYGQIAAALGTSTDAIHEVSGFIKRNLNPFPGRGHLEGNLSTGGETATPVSPDVII